MKKELLLKELYSKLEEIRIQDIDMVTISEKSILVCRDILKKLSDYIISNPFKDDHEEIHYFKIIKPQPLSLLCYYSRIWSFEMEFPEGIIEEQKIYIERKISRIHKSFLHSIEFIEYIKQNKNHLDKQYFTREFCDYLNFTNARSLCIDNRLFTSHDVLLGKIKGLNKFLIYLENRLIQIKRAKDQLQSVKDLSWTASKTDLTELIYALFSSKSINNGQVEISEIAMILSNQFNVDLGNFYRTFSSIRGRVNNRAKFLNNLKDSFLNMVEEFDA